MADFLLNALTTYGPAALGLALLVSSLGLPIPATIPLVAAGALARQSQMDWRAVLLLALSGVVVGDSIAFFMGRYGGGWVRRRVRRFGDESWQQAQGRFERHAALTIYSTRCFFNYIDVPVNLVAGGSGNDFGAFFIYMLAGRITWVLLYGGLGYLFASRWQEMAQTAGRFGAVATVLVLVGLPILFFYRRRRRKNQPTFID